MFISLLRRLGAVGLSLFLFAGFPALVLAQDDASVHAPHEPFGPKVSKSSVPDIATPEHRSMVGGPWLLDPNMKSTLYLRNGIETESIAVTPVLYLSNGVKLTLPVATLGPAATATIRLGDALQAQGIAPYANLKGYVELDYLSPYDPLCATVVSVDTVHSVIFTYGFRPTAPATITLKATGKPLPSKDFVDQRIDGVWWKHNQAVNGFISLSNTTEQSLNARLRVTGSDGAVLGTYPVALAPHVTSQIDLSELHAYASASAGSVQLTYNGPNDGILVNGGLEDITIGYSAAIPFRPHMEPSPDAASTAPKVTTLTELGLMTGAPDPMMFFPSATEFTPFSVISNVSVTPVSLVPELFWMDQGVTHRKALPAMSVPASQTVMLDTHSMLEQAGLANYNGVLNFTFKTGAPSSALLLASGSVDQTGTYVFQVQPHEIRESIAKTVSYWSVANGDDTMVTVWNPADEAQDFRFTLQYVGGSYVMPLHLEARASRSFNIASVIHDQIPDATGNVIPTTIREGSARIAGSHADNERILVDIDTGTYNVKKATCSYYCIACDGGVYLNQVRPVDFSMGTQRQIVMTEHTNTGYDYAYYGTLTWSSNATYVATVSNTGMANSVGVGNFTTSAYTNNAPVYNSNYCAYNASCPAMGYMSGSGPGTVNNYNITVTSSTPMTFGASGIIGITGTGFTNANFTGAPSITYPGITFSNVVVNSSTTMTASYTSSCSASVGSSPNGLTVTFTGTDGSQPSGIGPGSIVLPNIPPPILLFNGSQISGTPSVVVGQQIALTVQAPSLPNCIAFYNTQTGAQTFTPQWGTPTGTAVGGYTASVSAGSTVPLPSSSGSSYTLYWVTPGNSLQQTVRYYYTAWGYGNWSPSATASLNVAGPTSPNISAITKQVVIGPPPNLEFGLFESGIVGISLTGTANQTSGGSMSFVQLINYYNVKYFNGGNCSFSVGTGLDNTYPYPLASSSVSSISMNDSPDIPLYSNETEATASFGAITYLMWQSSTQGSIPVPLGNISWQWAGDAVRSGTVWSLKSGANNSGSAGTFNSSSSYPLWTTHVTNSPAPCH